VKSGPPAAAGSFDVVTVRNVSRTYGRRRAVHQLTFDAVGGEILGVLGPNGAGKSTLLGLLSTLLRPTLGEVRHGELGPDEAAAVRARIGVLGHDLFLYPELTARENLAFFARLYGVTEPDAAVSASLDRAGLVDRGTDLVSGFSRGMRQRLALERALIHAPCLVLLDEPFTGLDAASSATLVERLHGLRASGRIVVLATHDLELAEGLFDRVLFLREGRCAGLATRPPRLRSAYLDVFGA
jgi:heme exporter protein A